MNKVKRFITAALCAVMVFGVVVSNAYEAHAITEFALGIALQILNKAGATASELDAAKYTLRHSWDSVNVTSANLQEVTGDDLQSIAATLTASGIPCHVVSTTSVGGSGVRGYWIVCDAEPFYTSKSAYTRIDSSQTYTGKHYGIFSYSSTYEVYKYVYAKRENSGYYLSTILDYVIDIKNYLTNNIYPAIDQIEGYIAGLPNYITTATAWLSTQANNLSSLVTNTSNTVTNTANIYSRLGDILSVVRKNYYFGYKSDTNNVDYPTIPISWDTANSICSYLNNNFNHDGTINYISVSNQVGAQYTFYHARVAASGYIVVNVYEGGTAHDFVVCDRNHNCYMASDATSYDHISASLTSIIGYIDGVESTLSTISSRINTTNTRLNTVSSTLTSISNKLDNIDSADPIDYSSVLSQIAGNTDEDIYVTLYTSDSNGNSYSTVSYRPEIIDGLVSYINTHLANKPLKVLYRDGQDGQVADVVRNMMFVDFTSTGYVRLRVMWNNNSYGYAYLSSPSHVLVKQDNTYVDDSTFYQKLSDIESALFGTVETRSTALVPIGESMLDVVSNGTTIISNVVALSSPIGLIKTGVDTIVDLIEAFDEEPDYTTVLNNINNALRVTVDGDTYTVAQLESISAQHLNNIEEWLTAADLLDNQTITTIVNSYGSDIVDGVTKSSKFIQLYQKAFGSLRSYGIDDDYIWNSIYDYFDTFYGGGSQ